MRELLLRAAWHNAWANEQFIELLLTLSNEALDREIVSSFPSIRKTVLHIWGAEDVWLQRFESSEKAIWKPATFSGGIEELCGEWRMSSSGLIRFAAHVEDDQALSRLLTVVTLKGDIFKDSLGAALQHVFNHGAYHRGQLVTMLRQVGITTIPQTDLIVYMRQKG